MGSNNNPFGNSIKYTKPPAIFLAYIQIDGETAANGDTVAIYVGEELRCVQIVQLVQNFSIITGNVQMLNDSETITKIEIWDASENVILEVPNFTLEILSGIATDYITISGIIKNEIPVISDLQLVSSSNGEKIYSFSVIDDNEVNITFGNLPCWIEYSMDGMVHILTSNPGLNNIGSHTFTIYADDNFNSQVSKEFTIVVDVSDVLQNRYTFNENNFTDISSLFENVVNVKSAKLRFVSVPCVTTSIEAEYNKTNTAEYINMLFNENISKETIELEIITEDAFKPEFMKYRNGNLIEMVLMEELNNDFVPNRWARQELNSYKVVFQGYARDLHMNNGCVQTDFDAGICEDPHILTFGGNRLDLPHDDNVYNMIDGLGLKINVKSQILGNGSYAKYFYINYKNEEFILDIDNLELKNNMEDIKTKYHMLTPCDYSGYDFQFEKLKRSLIVKSTDGIMELIFNSETRGLLIKSRLDFTQENSTGIMMSNSVDECLIKALND